MARQNKDNNNFELWDDWQLTEAQEDRLRDALSLAAEREFAAIVEEELSPRAQRRFALMKTEPMRYAKAHKAGWLRHLGRYGVVAAALLLALGLGTFALSPPARAGIMQIFDQQGMRVQSYASYDKLVFSEPQTDARLPELEVGYWPEGWTLASEKLAEDGRSLRLVFLPEEPEPEAAEQAFAQALEVRAAVAEEGLDICLQNSGMKVSEAEIGGCPARIYAAEAPGQPSYIMWLAAEGRVFVMVDGDLPMAELVAVAESIEIDSLSR